MKRSFSSAPNQPAVLRSLLPSLLLPLLLLLACDATVETGLDEQSANAIVVALDEANIGARKEAEEGDEGLFRIIVPEGDLGGALRQLRAVGLPRDSRASFEEVFGEGGLVPTATEEQARYLAALTGELSSSIEMIEGVLEARVHVALPDNRRVSLDDSRQHARASVLIKHATEAVPYDEASIRALVAGAIQDMSLEDVAIVSIRAVPRAATRGQLVAVGPFQVSQGSATPLKAALAAALLLHLLLAGLLVLVLMRRKPVTPLVEDSAPPVE